MTCTTKETVLPGKIVLVLHDTEADLSFSERNAKIKYIDDYMIPQVLFFKDHDANKLNIYTSRPVINIAYQDNKLITLNYLFKNGDSIQIILEGKMPIMKILNREVSDYESNFEKTIKENLYDGKSTPLEKFYHFWNLANSSSIRDFDIDFQDELDELKLKAIESLKRESRFIDSLLANKHISEEIAGFYQLENNFTFNKLRLYKSDKLDFSNSEEVRDLFLKKDRPTNDSVEDLNYYVFYDDILFRYYQDYLSGEVQILNQSTQIESLYSIEYIPENARKSLLYWHVDNVLNKSTVLDGNELLSLLSNRDTLFTHWVIDFTKKYNLNQEFSRSWHLQDHKGQVFTFNELLRYTQGSLLYIDFWAGWCLPCLKEIPLSAELSQEYQQKNIKFIYFSIDNSFDKWRIADKKFIVHDNNGSFYIDSLNQQVVKGALNIRSIPRYLLFNEEGLLVHVNAPGPGSDAIRELFDKYLADGN